MTTLFFSKSESLYRVLTIAGLCCLFGMTQLAAQENTLEISSGFKSIESGESYDSVKLTGGTVHNYGQITQADVDTGSNLSADGSFINTEGSINVLNVTTGISSNSSHIDTVNIYGLRGYNPWEQEVFWGHFTNFDLTTSDGFERKGTVDQLNLFGGHANNRAQVTDVSVENGGHFYNGNVSVQDGPLQGVTAQTVVAGGKNSENEGYVSLVTNDRGATIGSVIITDGAELQVHGGIVGTASVTDGTVHNTGTIGSLTIDGATTGYNNGYVSQTQPAFGTIENFTMNAGKFSNNKDIETYPNATTLAVIDKADIHGGEFTNYHYGQVGEMNQTGGAVTNYGNIDSVTQTDKSRMQNLAKVGTLVQDGGIVFNSGTIETVRQEGGFSSFINEEGGKVESLTTSQGATENKGSVENAAVSGDATFWNTAAGIVEGRITQSGGKVLNSGSINAAELRGGFLLNAPLTDADPSTASIASFFMYDGIAENLGSIDRMELRGGMLVGASSDASIASLLVADSGVLDTRYLNQEGTDLHTGYLGAVGDLSFDAGGRILFSVDDLDSFSTLNSWGDVDLTDALATVSFGSFFETEDWDWFDLESLFNFSGDGRFVNEDAWAWSSFRFDGLENIDWYFDPADASILRRGAGEKAATPEPSTLLIFTLGAMALPWARRRFRAA